MLFFFLKYSNVATKFVQHSHEICTHFFCHLILGGKDIVPPLFRCWGDMCPVPPEARSLLKSKELMIPLRDFTAHIGKDVEAWGK